MPAPSNSQNNNGLSSIINTLSTNSGELVKKAGISISQEETLAGVEKILKEQNSNFLKPLAANSVILAGAAKGDRQYANRAITDIGNRIERARQTAMGDYKPPSTLSFDSSTSIGIAQALAFSTIPGMASLYARGIRKMADALASLKDKNGNIKALGENQEAFDVILRTISTLSGLKAFKLWRAAMSFGFVATRIGKALGRALLGIEHGLTETLEKGGVKTQSRMGEKSARKFSMIFTDVMDAVSTLAETSFLKLLKSSFLLRMLGGFIGKNIGKGINKILDAAEIQPGLLDRFINFHESLTSVFTLISNIPWASLIGPLADAIQIPWRKFKASIEQIEEIGNILLTTKAHAFKKLKDIVAPFTQPLIKKFENIKEISQISKGVSWMRLRFGMFSLRAIAKSILAASITFQRITNARWKSFEKGLEKIGDFKEKIEEILSINAWDAIKQLAAIAVIAIGSLIGMSFAIKQFADIEPATYTKAIGAIAMLGIMGAGMIKAAKILMAGSTSMIAVGKPLAIAAGVIAAFIAAIGGSSLLFGKAIIAIGEGFKILSEVDLSNFSVIKFGAIMGALATGGVALIPGSAGLWLASKALPNFALGLKSLTMVPWEKLKAWDIYDILDDLGDGGRSLARGEKGLRLGGIALGFLTAPLTALSNININALNVLGPALISLQNSLEKLSFKTRGTEAVVRQMRSLASALRELTDASSSEYLESLSSLLSNLTFASINFDSPNFDKVIGNLDKTQDKLSKFTLKDLEKVDKVKELLSAFDNQMGIELNRKAATEALNSAAMLYNQMNNQLTNIVGGSTQNVYNETHLLPEITPRSTIKDP